MPKVRSLRLLEPFEKQTTTSTVLNGDYHEEVYCSGYFPAHLGYRGLRRCAGSSSRDGEGLRPSLLLIA